MSISLLLVEQRDLDAIDLGGVAVDHGQRGVSIALSRSLVPQ